ncbi:MAG: sulfatase-like hydrolase/transferase [Eubacteriales bacterium]|nr:sulfatase-like hydrolase/transferase [Eubacteriales bacterium]
MIIRIAAFELYQKAFNARKISEPTLPDGDDIHIMMEKLPPFFRQSKKGILQMEKPNILVFMADHFRWDMAPPYKRAITPNLERLAANGLVFDHTYCPSPHCCPSRTTFFTGLYPSEHGVWNNVAVGNALSRGPYPGTPFFSDYMKNAGYDLYYTGKWHVSVFEGPSDRGFQAKKIIAGKSDHFIQQGNTAPYTGEWSDYADMRKDSADAQRKPGHIIRPGYPDYVQYYVNEKPFSDEAVVEAAISMIKARGKPGKPWFQFVGTEGPHDPYNVPQRFLDLYPLDEIELPESFDDDMTDKPAFYRRTKSYFSQLTEIEHKVSLQHFLAFCSYEDYLFGKVYEALEESGECDNTLILFTSDHGDYAGEHGLWTKGLPCFNSAYRIPLVMSWKNGIKNPGRKIDHFVSLADFAPTFCEIAGVSEKTAFSGISLLSLMSGQKPNQWRDAVFTQSNGNEQYGIQRSVMTQKYKYVYNGFDFDELYDLQKDPLQMENIINDPQNREIVKEMCKKMWSFAFAHKDVCINPYIMVGFAPFGPGIIFEEE